MERLFQSIGLSESKAKDTLKNSSVSNALQSYILEVQLMYTTVHMMFVCFLSTCMMHAAPTRRAYWYLEYATPLLPLLSVLCVCVRVRVHACV